MLTTMRQKRNNVELIVMSCCVLHNLLQDRYPQLGMAAMDAEDPIDHQIIPGIWRNENMLVGLDAAPGNTSAKVAKVVRNYLKGYYSSPAGKVAWQDNMI